MSNEHLKQKNIPWLGAFVDSLYVSLPLLSIINFLSIITVLYATIATDLQTYAPWLNFWLFLFLLVVITVLTMITVYKFVVPSLWTFRSKQMFSHESAIVDKLNELIEKVDKLNERNDTRKD